MRSVLITILMLSACLPGANIHDGDIDVDGTGPAEDPSDACTAQILWVTPGDDAGEVPIHSEIEIGFSEALPMGGSWELDVIGVEGLAALAPDRRSASFHVQDKLEHDTTYMVRAQACDNIADFDFQTLRRPIPNSALVGRTYLLDLLELDWLAPSAVDIFLPYLADLDGLMVDFAPDVERRGTLRMRARLSTTGHDPRPHSCAPMAILGMVDLQNNPMFSTSPEDLPLEGPSGTVHLGNVTIEGTIGPRGETLEDLRLHGLLDVRPIEDVSAGVLDLCAASAAIGEPCEPCPDGVNACLTTVVFAIEAPEVLGVDLDTARYRDSYDTCE